MLGPGSTILCWIRVCFTSTVYYRMRCIESETTMMLQVTVPQSDRHDTGVMYTKLTVKQLDEEAPGVSPN